MLTWLILLLTSQGYAQNITASFDPTSFGENPAAAATRDFGIIGPAYTFESSREKIKRSGVEDVQRDIETTRYDLLLAGKGTKIVVPELFLSQNKSSLRIQSDENDVSTFNAFGNLAIHLGKNLKVGVGAFNIDVDYKTKTQTYTGNSILKTLGVTGGSILVAGQFAFGGYYTKVSEGLEGGSTYTDPQGAVQNNSFKEGYAHEKYGVGAAFQKGSSKRSGGLRIEYSFSKMNFASTTSMLYAEPTDVVITDRNLLNTQQRLAIELTRFGFTGGVAVTRTYGRYINYKYFLDGVLTDFPFYESPTNAFSGFLGFQSTSGHSFGIKAMYWQGTNSARFQMQQAEIDSTEFGYGVSYAYAF